MAISRAARILQPLGERHSWLPSIAALAFSVVIWAAVGLGPYSGCNTPPQYGDFEAQRHWMEITTHLKPKEWYFDDFNWWRLDYPPLTAYHSWLCGIIGGKLDPAWFALKESRGFESPSLQAFMRATVIASQLVAYASSCWLWVKMHVPVSRTGTARAVAYGSILLLPSLTIIDHGHFQYNSVMLGLVVGTLYALKQAKFVKASILFVWALFFKQMALYYAPAIFFAILGHCIGPAVKWELQLRRLFSVAAAVVFTSLILLSPFHEPKQLLQIVTRIFPVFRGLWEDKVANLWCTINYTGFKLKERFDEHQLQYLALAATLLGIAPSCIAAFVGKTKLWPWAFASCAWSFFLFSFQVHEKSVLLPLIPTILTAIQHPQSTNISAMVSWISNVSMFSMWPLLKREDLRLQFFVLLVAYNWLFYSPSSMLPSNPLNKLAVLGSYSFFAAVALAEALNLVPGDITSRYPDIFIVGNMTASFGCFIYFWLWQTWYMLTLTTLD